VPKPNIDTLDKIKRPNTFANVEIKTICIFVLRPLITANNVAGPGLVT